MERHFASVVSIRKKSLRISKNVVLLIPLIRKLARCIYVCMSWLVADLKSLMKQLGKSRWVSHLKVSFSYFVVSGVILFLDLKSSLFKDVMCKEDSESITE